MSDDRTKNLIIRFTTDALPAQRDIQGFAQVSGAALLQLGVNANRSSAALSDLSSKAEGLKQFTDRIPLLGGLVGKALNLVSAASRDAEESISHLLAIADGASRAGVGTTFFQAYTLQARELGVETKTLVDELNKAADAGKVSIATAGDADSGKSDALKTLEKTVAAGNLGSGSVAAFTGADGGEARIRVMLDLLEQLDQKGAKLAEYDLAKSFFGDSFEQRLRTGQDAIGDMRDKLDEIQQSGGAQIVPEEQIQRAKIMKAEIDDLNQRLATVTAPTSNTINSIFQAIDEALISGEAVIVTYVEKLAEFVGKWMGAGTAVSDLKNKILDLADAMRKIANLPPLQRTPSGDVDPSDPTGSKLAAAKVALSEKMGGAPLPPPRPDLPAAQVGAYGALVPLDPKSTELTVTPKKPVDTSHPYLAKDKPTSESDANDRVQNYIDGLKKSQQAEEAEAQTLGLSNKAKEEAIALAKGAALADDENRTLTAAETAEIKRRTDAIVDAKAKIEAFALAQERAKDQAEFFGQTFETAIEGIVVQANSLADVLKGVVQAIEAALLKAAILGEGPMANLFGTAPAAGATGTAAVGGLFGMALKGLGSFGGFFADGGALGAGQWGIAGEKGPELIMGPSNVMPNVSAAQLRGPSGGATINHAPTYNITPADGVTPAQLSAVLARHDQQFNRTIGSRMADWSRRYG